MESEGFKDREAGAASRGRRDCVAEVRALTARGERWERDMRRRFGNTIAGYRGRHDVASWPADPDRDPVGPEGCFFYRPGQLLVRDDDLKHLECVLSGLGVESCGRTSPEGGTVTRLIVATPVPAPLLVRQLRRLGIGPRSVTLNHVWWPTTAPSGADFTLDGAPWWSGGSESAPQPANGSPTLACEERGAGVKVAVLDSALLEGWQRHQWMHHVNPVDHTRDVGVPDGGPGDGTVLDIYDSHGTAVAGVVAARAPGATVVLRDVLNELGDVDEFALIDAIRQTLRADPGISIVNLSLGGTTSGDLEPLELDALLDEFPGVVFVAAAGNNGAASTHSVWPAACEGVIGVGALDAQGNRAPFSNVAPSADIWAPGAGVLTAFGTGTLDYGASGLPDERFDGIAIWSGTSFAAPYVSGLLCDFVALPDPAPTGPPSAGGTSRTTRALQWLRANASAFAGDASGDVIQL
jgi:hypothetical protein